MCAKSHESSGISNSHKNEELRLSELNHKDQDLDKTFDHIGIDRFPPVVVKLLRRQYSNPLVEKQL